MFSVLAVSFENDQNYPISTKRQFNAKVERDRLTYFLRVQGKVEKKKFSLQKARSTDVGKLKLNNRKRMKLTS